MDNIPRIDEPEPNPAADRRGNATVNELQFGVFDLSLISFYGALVLAHECLLRIQLLLGDGVLLVKRLVALQIELRVFEQRLVARHLTLCFGELHLERARVDFGEQISSFNDLAFLEAHAHELTLDTGFDGNSIKRSY